MYTSRRPAVILPNTTMFVPNFADLGTPATAAIATNGIGANSVRYIPFSPAYDTAVKSISAWVVAGTTENFDLGLYDGSFTRLGALGSTGVASTTGIKTWTPTTPIGVQANTIYFAAIVASANTVTWVTQSIGSPLRGASTEASAPPLPASGTPTPAALNAALPFLKIVFSG